MFRISLHTLRAHIFLPRRRVVQPDNLQIISMHGCRPQNVIQRKTRSPCGATNPDGQHLLALAINIQLLSYYQSLAGFDIRETVSIGSSN
jgi:hypothetical protein